MTQAQPETKFNEALGSLMACLKGQRRLTEFELRSVRRDVEALARVDASGRFELLGMLAAVDGDQHEVVALFDKALAITGDRVGTAVRYMQTLSLMSIAEGVESVWSSVAVSFRTNIDALREAQKIAGFMGIISIVKTIEEWLGKAGVASEWRSFLSASGELLDDDDVKEPVQFAHRFLRDRGRQPAAFRMSLLPSDQGDSAFVLYELSVNAAPSVVAELEWELFGVLAEQDFEAEQSGRLRVALGVSEAP